MAFVTVVMLDPDSADEYIKTRWRDPLIAEPPYVERPKEALESAPVSETPEFADPDTPFRYATCVGMVVSHVYPATPMFDITPAYTSEPQLEFTFVLTSTCGLVVVEKTI
jgi:hypothetical protein